MRKILFLAASILLVISCTGIKHMHRGLKEGVAAKNTIFMIVDGMGFEHIKAARIYNGQKPFSFEKFPCKSKVTTCSVHGADENGQCLSETHDVTDSAAGATAMAAGVKVKNGAISQSKNYELKTILEILKEEGKSTGVIATKLFTDATPAAFISHADGRTATEEILKDIFENSKPTLILGADNKLHKTYAEKSGAYRMVSKASELKSLAKELSLKPCSGESCPQVYGGFGQWDMIPGVYANKSGLILEINSGKEFSTLGIPHLSEMTDAALKILSQNDKGFFLMVESSMPDMISHYNAQIEATGTKAISVLIPEMLEVEKTAQVIEAFIKNHPDTLLVLTADHETGGLVVKSDETKCLGQKKCVPKVMWTSEKYEPTIESAARHTAADVPLYAIGKGFERYCQEKINNIHIPNLALGN